MCFVGGFACLDLALALQGDRSAAAGALLVAGLVAPLLLEAWRPGKYHLRTPDDGSADTLLNRLRQFRRDHPGSDGTVIILVFYCVLAALFAGVIRSILHSFLQP